MSVMRCRSTVGLWILLAASLTCCNVASGLRCQSPTVYHKYGGLNVEACFEEEILENGLRHSKLTQELKSDLRADAYMKTKRTLTEELVRCENLADIPNHQISDFECLKYEAFANQSIFLSSKARDSARFMKRYIIKSKSELLGHSKTQDETIIYPFSDEASNQQSSLDRLGFFNNRSDVTQDGGYFVMKLLSHYQIPNIVISGDFYISTIEDKSIEYIEDFDLRNLLPKSLLLFGSKIGGALDSGRYLLSFKNLAITFPILGDPVKFYVNFTMGQQKNFPYFYLENTATTSIPQLFDYNALITQENTSDRYTTSEAYSTHVTIGAKSKIRELNLQLRQKFENSGRDLYEWYETMRLNTRHFSADVLTIAEDGFTKRLHVTDKEGRRGLEVTYGDNHDDAVDFKIHVKKSIITGIFSDITKGLGEFMGENGPRTANTYSDHLFKSSFFDS